MIKLIHIRDSEYTGCLGKALFDEGDITERELMQIKQNLSRSSIDWAMIDPEITHAVWYAEAINRDGEIYFANLYVEGAAHFCTDKEFETFYQRPGIGYVVAAHRR